MSDYFFSQWYPDGAEYMSRFLKSAIITGLFLIHTIQMYIWKTFFIETFLFCVVQVTFDELTDAFDKELRHND